MIENNNKTSNIPLSQDYKNLHVRPWLRFFARYVDLFIFGFCLEGFLILFYPPLVSTNEIANSLFILFCWIFVEATLLATWGTSLGKFIFNIKMTDLKGNKPKFYSALERSFSVWIIGFGMGIPVVYLFTLIASYSRLMNTGTTAWDKDKFIVTHGKIGALRAITIAIILILVLLATSWSVISQSNLYYQKQKTPSPDHYAEYIKEQNKKLPLMVDSETELTKMYFEKNTLNYQYRLTNKEASDFNIPMFYESMRKQIMEEACDKSSPNQTLSRGSNLSFNYQDKNGMPIMAITIKPSDCN